MAENLYKYIIARCKEHIDIVEQGEFGASESGKNDAEYPAQVGEGYDWCNCFNEKVSAEELADYLRDQRQLWTYRSSSGKIV